jgi:hypothetical protein
MMRTHLLDFPDGNILVLGLGFFGRARLRRRGLVRGGG